MGVAGVSDNLRQGEAQQRRCCKQVDEDIAFNLAKLLGDRILVVVWNGHSWSPCL